MSRKRKTRLASELDAGWTTRCGRCSEILPDETLTFCPVCGIPFSRVPPTNEFSLLVERRRLVKYLDRTGWPWDREISLLVDRLDAMLGMRSTST